MGGMSPMYAAPETFTGQISKHSDQYSLAIVYMELISGQRPFTARTIRQLALQHMSEEPDLRALPERDRPVVARALAKDPAKRFPNCVSFIRALGGLVTRPDSFTDIETPTPYPPRPITPEEKTPPTAPRFKTEPPQKKAVGPKEIDVESQSLHATQVQVEVGTLRPTIIVGVGAFGLLAMKELRRRLLDRLGDLTQAPSFKFLYVDVDPDAPAEATGGPNEPQAGDESMSFRSGCKPITTIEMHPRSPDRVAAARKASMPDPGALDADDGVASRSAVSLFAITLSASRHASAARCRSPRIRSRWRGR